MLTPNQNQHMYVPLQCSCSSHMDPILLQTPVKKQLTSTFISHPIAIYVSPEKMPIKYHMLHMQTSWDAYMKEIYQYICHIWRHLQINAITINKYFAKNNSSYCHIPWRNMAATLLIYVLMYCYCSLHIDPTLLCISVNKQQTELFSSHPIAKYVPPENMPTECHMYAICTN